MATCGKRSWSNAHAARRKLAEIRKRRDRHPGHWKVEVRAYRCPDCKRWHVTSHQADYVLPSQRRPLRVIESAE